MLVKKQKLYNMSALAWYWDPEIQIILETVVILKYGKQWGIPKPCSGALDNEVSHSRKASKKLWNFTKFFLKNAEVNSFLVHGMYFPWCLKLSFHLILKVMRCSRHAPDLVGKSSGVDRLFS